MYNTAYLLREKSFSVFSGFSSLGVIWEIQLWGVQLWGKTQSFGGS